MSKRASSSAPVILVTGAARRIGAEIARAVHAAGATVIVHYRHSSAAAQTLNEELNSRRRDSAWTIAGELQHPGTAAEIIDKIYQRHQRIDGIVNNASTFFPTPLARIDEAAWDDLIGSNLKGPLFLCQAAAPQLRASRGAIVNILDVHAERPMRGYALYCTAKAGLQGLTRALAVDLAPEIRVNGVAPGTIAWPAANHFSEEERARILGETLLGRIGDAADIARTVRFLLFDAPYITGQIIAVDGGRSVHL